MCLMLGYTTTHVDEVRLPHEVTVARAIRERYNSSASRLCTYLTDRLNVTELARRKGRLGPLMIHVDATGISVP